MAENQIATLDTLNDVLDAESRGFAPQTVTIKINHQEATFTIPGMPAVKRLTGVLLASKKVRVLFPRMGVKEDTEKILTFTGNRPLCSSDNYTQGQLTDAEWDKAPEQAVFIKNKIAEGGLDCTTCPLGGDDAWGSVELLGNTGKGKACGDLRRLLYWQSGMGIPTILPIPTSSIRAWDSYCSGLQVGGQSHNRVVTEINLVTKEAPGMKWAVANFVFDSPMTEELALELMQDVDGVPLAVQLINIFKGKEVELDEYATNGNTDKKKPAAEEDF